jgi:hypothetical protein
MLMGAGPGLYICSDVYVRVAGIVGFYKDFVEALYENLGGQASVTGKLA